MHEYKMDPVSMLKKQSGHTYIHRQMDKHTDGQTDGQMDSSHETSIPPPPPPQNLAEAAGMIR